MDYEQKNPLPLPEIGPFEKVLASFETTFDWKYALDRENLLALYEKGKERTWNATDLDWSINVDLERSAYERVANGAHEVVNQLLSPPKPLGPEESAEMNLNMIAWMLSQFLHGEQGALLATAKIVMAAPLAEAKWYGANQVADEARHVEVYHRYLTEKMGRSFEVNRHLQVLLDDILADSRWDMTYLGMQILVEGLALAAFGVMRIELPDEPLIQDITSRIMQDESRHVAFGVLSLEDLYRNQLSSAELKEREDFIIEATHLMRDRLLMEQVYERMGWDVDVWVEWAKNTPFMTGFRQMLFSKIVPNLKRLGLLTPRVREVYGELGILQYEHLKDSTEDAEMTLPPEMIELVKAVNAGSKTA
jgi:hypothetical protein